MRFEIDSSHAIERRTLLMLLLAGAATAAWTNKAAAQPAGMTLVVSYVEALPRFTRAVERGLQAYAQGLRKDPKRPAVQILREIGRPQRLAVIERWRADPPADGDLQRALDGMLQAPVDRRGHTALGPLADADAAPFHMLMHVDVVPPSSAAAAALLDAQRSAVMAAGGARGFEAATQSDRMNHFAVHEAWSSRAAYEAYAASPPAQALRRQLATMKGALYDDRFYVALAPGG